MTIPTTQKLYKLVKDGAGFKLQAGEGAVKQPGANEVLIRIHASSLNRRDVMITKGWYPVGDRTELVPLSDGAGEVVAVGASVKRFKNGDRVMPAFFQGWASGKPGAMVGATSLGGAVDGVLAQYVTFGEEGVVAIPEHLSYEEASTLPCAGVTAWNGLFTRGNLKAGDFVLLQGTGGVAIFGVQLAAAAGAKPVVTSSSDDKIARAKKLGAVAGVNYKNSPDWEGPVREATGGRGADQILELGGQGTLAKSLASLAPGGHVALIGGLAGFGGDLAAVALIGRNATASGIMVGSREHFEALNAFLSKHKIKPIIDRTFAFGEAQAAYDHMDAGSHFGKIVIKHD